MKTLLALGVCASASTVGELWTSAARQLCEMEPRVGAVEDCTCDFAVVDEATETIFGPLLRNLTSRRFFRYFKVNLDRPCPFWPDDGVCGRESCAVKQCADDEVPAPWLAEERNRTKEPEVSVPAFMCGDAGLGDVDRSHDQVQGWAEQGGDEVWIVQDEDEAGMAYVDLLRNPEGYTGYDGEPARRVWRAVYEENCFDLETPAPPKEQLVLAWREDKTAKAASGAPSQCLERRVFYKLISGLQASISTHIAHSPFTFWEVVMSAPATLKRRAAALVGAAAARCARDDAVCLAAANDALFLDRVGGHKDRLQNLYFAYLFVLRAVAVAGPQLEHYAVDTGDAEDDAATQRMLRTLVSEESTPFPFNERGECAAAAAARAAFDETMLFKAPEAPGMSPLEKALARESVEELRAQFVQRFRNVSTIMDCVTCEKCRLWGKLQVLGLGTALKILLMEGDESGTGVLQRNEVVALVNTLAQLARSVDSIRDWQRRDVRKAHYQLLASTVLAGIGALGFLLAAAAALRRRRRAKKEV